MSRLFGLNSFPALARLTSFRLNPYTGQPPIFLTSRCHRKEFGLNHQAYANDPDIRIDKRSDMISVAALSVLWYKDFIRD
ncbi:hypothetical protein DSO57_1031082 [Entomophthora muscae]|uniref:Uncharacterized protein n=1 Tax=Entomophthora muscae TaxID=34485 RepID=A0ACC2U9S4_9FUNG|nr:hypothetical protein DSO57_1031082 [Entomophthora muscae]